jgi:hypothetical protein
MRIGMHLYWPSPLNHPPTLCRPVQVSVKYANSGAVPFGGAVGNAAKDGVIDLLITENIFYGRAISRIYDLKGSERDRYAADNPAIAGGRTGGAPGRMRLGVHQAGTDACESAGAGALEAWAAPAHPEALWYGRGRNSGSWRLETEGIWGSSRNAA